LLSVWPDIRGPGLCSGLQKLWPPPAFPPGSLLSSLFYGLPGYSATSGAEEGGAGEAEPSSLHRAISSRPIRPSPSWQASSDVCFILRLREELSLMLAWSVMICRGGARARARGHSVECIFLVAQNQHQAAIIKADLLGQWIARDFLESQKSFHGVGALRFWAFYLVDEFLSIHVYAPNTYKIC